MIDEHSTHDFSVVTPLITFDCSFIAEAVSKVAWLPVHTAIRFQLLNQPMETTAACVCAFEVCVSTSVYVCVCLCVYVCMCVCVRLNVLTVRVNCRHALRVFSLPRWPYFRQQDDTKRLPCERDDPPLIFASTENYSNFSVWRLRFTCEYECTLATQFFGDDADNDDDGLWDDRGCFVGKKRRKRKKKTEFAFLTVNMKTGPNELSLPHWT